MQLQKKHNNSFEPEGGHYHKSLGCYQIFLHIYILPTLMDYIYILYLYPSFSIYTWPVDTSQHT